MAMLKVKAGRENWVRDTDVANCSMCMVKFSVLTRKHHCRACGNIFCSSCSSAEISFTPSTRKNEKGYAEKKKRVCKACFKNINDGARRNSKPKMIADGAAKGGVGSFLNANMATVGNSFMGNSFIATSLIRPTVESFTGKSFQLTFERPGEQAPEKTTALAMPKPQAMSRPQATHVFLSLNPFNWAESFLRRNTVERRFSFDQTDAAAAFLIMQQEEKRRAMSGCETEPEQEPHALAGSRRQSLEPTAGGAPGAQQHGAVVKDGWEFDPVCADEEEASLQSTFTYYFEKLQAQQRLLEARLYEQEQADDDMDISQVPLHMEAAIVDKQFEELVRKSNLYDQVSPAPGAGDKLCDKAGSPSSRAQAEADVPKCGKQYLSVTNTNRAKLLKLSLAVLKLSLKYEYRKKQVLGARGSTRPMGKIRDLTLRN